MIENATTSTISFAIYHDLPIEAAPEKVFAAVSEPAHLTNWWPLKCTGQPIEGSIYNFYFGPEYDWYGEVIKSVPNEAFHIKMTRSDPDWDPTSFGFDLREIGKGTQLQFWHAGWPACNAHYRTASFCWALLLKGLKDYVEKGEVIPFSKRS